MFRLQNWKSHKEYCLKVKAAGANTFDAILFAMNETNPRLIKIPWELIPADESEPTSYQKLDKDIWFKQADTACRPNYVQRLGKNGPKLEHSLCIWYDDNFGINGSPVNRCIDYVTGGRAGHQWCGNILALRMGRSYDLYENVDIQEDLKPLVKFFEDYGK